MPSLNHNRLIIAGEPLGLNRNHESFSLIVISVIRLKRMIKNSGKFPQKSPKLARFPRISRQKFKYVPSNWLRTYVYCDLWGTSYRYRYSVSVGSPFCPYRSYEKKQFCYYTWWSCTSRLIRTLKSYFNAADAAPAPAANDGAISFLISPYGFSEIL